MSLRSEPRAVRPFRIAAGVADALSGVRLHVDELEFEPGPLQIGRDALLTSELGVTLGLDLKAVRSGLAAMDVDPADASVAVIVYGVPWRRHTVVLRSPLSGKVADRVPIPRDLDRLVFGSTGGFDLRAVVMLERDLQPRAVTPWRAGTWLARAEFHVRPEPERYALNPTLLTSALREEHEIDDEALWWVRVRHSNDELLEAATLDDAITVYLDENAYNLMVGTTDEPVGEFLQSLLAVDLIMEVSLGIVRALDSAVGGEAGAGDLASWPSADRLLSQVAGTIEVSVEDVLDLAHADPARLRTRVQNAMNTTTAAKAALKGVR